MAASAAPALSVAARRFLSVPPTRNTDPQNVAQQHKQQHSYPYHHDLHDREWAMHHHEDKEKALESWRMRHRIVDCGSDWERLLSTLGSTSTIMGLDPPNAAIALVRLAQAGTGAEATIASDTRFKDLVARVKQGDCLTFLSVSQVTAVLQSLHKLGVDVDYSKLSGQNIKPQNYQQQQPQQQQPRASPSPPGSVRAFSSVPPRNTADGKKHASTLSLEPPKEQHSYPYHHDLHDREWAMHHHEDKEKALESWRMRHRIVECGSDWERLLHTLGDSSTIMGLDPPNAAIALVRLAQAGTGAEDAICTDPRFQDLVKRVQQGECLTYLSTTQLAAVVQALRKLGVDVNYSKPKVN